MPKPRPKPPTYPPSIHPPPSKKPRFDLRNPSALAADPIDPSEEEEEEIPPDPLLLASTIGKTGPQTKRNAINLEGYESDSENEGFDARAEAKAKERDTATAGAVNKEAKSQDEEANDMFADMEEDENKDGDEEEERSREGKRKRKEVRFLATDEIEGQVISSTSGGHVSADFAPPSSSSSHPNRRRRDSDSTSSSSADSETRASLSGAPDVELGAGGKKTHAPRLEAFNMKREQEEEGRFDAEGNFVRRAADPDAGLDSWLEGVSGRREMRRAREGKGRMERRERERLVREDGVLTGSVLGELCFLLGRGETVLGALARLGRGKPRRGKGKGGKRKRKRGEEETMDVDIDGDGEGEEGNEEEEERKEKKRRETVEAITVAADRLLTRGYTEIYDVEREMLTRMYKRETGEEWVDPSSSSSPPPSPSAPLLPRPRPSVEGEGEEEGERGRKRWEYRWSDARDGGEAHGPYEAGMMVAWKEAGYFGPGGVEFREVVGGGERKNGRVGKWIFST